MLKAASAIAIKATKKASWVTTDESFGITPSSISFFNRSGVATIKAASTTTVAK